MNIFETINSNIVAALERGVIPWRSGWKGGFPANFATKREYRGINVLLLMLAEKDSPYWMTFNQAKSLGGTVRKGSKGVRVVYWHWRTADEVAKLKQARPGADIAPCYPFVSVVFNAADIDGLEFFAFGHRLQISFLIKGSNFLNKAVADEFGDFSFVTGCCFGGVYIYDVFHHYLVK